MKLTHSDSRIFIDGKDITTDFILTAVKFFKGNTVQEFGYNGECTNLLINVKNDKESIERLVLMLNEILTNKA